MKAFLERHGKMMRGGTIVDATIIEAPTSTKNAGKRRDWNRHIAYQKFRVRSKVEYAFLIFKRLFGYRKVRYRGLEKNRTHALILGTCANLFMLAQSGWRMGNNVA